MPELSTPSALPTQAEWALTRTVSINNNLSVTMTAGPGGFTCDWIPDRPRGLSRKEIRRYRAGRDELLAKVGERMGGSVLVLEI
jgi:hypothetical protein